MGADMKRVTLIGMVLGLSLLSACKDGKGSAADAGLSVPLTAAEKAGLLYLREEEELARDLYMTIFNNKGLVSFQNISLNSETKHAQAMLGLLNTYGVADPSTGQPDSYTNAGLQTLYNKLLADATGATSTSLSALMVGALVEEVDILDINLKKAQVQPVHALIIATYDNLLCGSRNHLRAFVPQIEALTGTAYTVQTPAMAAEVQAILSSAKEQCKM